VGLYDVVLVGHDCGGALALDWAARYLGQTRGVAFLETIVRPMSWEDFPASARPAFESLRTPGPAASAAMPMGAESGDGGLGVRG
jgi:haloalkane dehalogenase